jgi:c-di-GMP-binding flagellar brake protein YcgR
MTVPGSARPIEQRRAAFRVDLALPVWVEYPIERDCELVDLSVLGARLSAELPCSPGSTSEFLLVTEDYGTIPITGEVVRVSDGETAVKFIRLEHDAERAVTDLITAAQRQKLQRRLGVA